MFIHTLPDMPLAGPPGAERGPGPAQIWRIYGLVKFKTDGKNAAVWSEIWRDLQKQKKFRALHADFSLSWAP